MLTWHDIQSHLQARYPVTLQGPRQFLLTFSYPDQRSQMIRIEGFDALEREWLCVRTRVCALANLAPQEALLRNRELVIGHLCLEGDYYLLTRNYLLSTLDLPELELGMQVIARTADELESALQGGADRF